MSVKIQDVLISDNTVYVYYPGSDILMYTVNMNPISTDNTYGFIRKGIINHLRTKSGLCARVSDDILQGNRGSAAMIDYAMRESLYGEKDARFMYGSVDAVRSRVRIIQNELVRLAKKCLTTQGSFRLFEAGHGFIRTKIHLMRELEREGFDIECEKIVGCDINPDVVDVVRIIIGYENLHDIIQVYEGHAVDCLNGLGEKFDVGLAEGVFEYMDLRESRDLARAFHRSLADNGLLIATATHKIPKAAVARLLDFYFEPRSEADFIEIFTRSRFEHPRLIKTDPPNISVGIARKTARSGYGAS